jgi:hypothetical protein
LANSLGKRIDVPNHFNKRVIDEKNVGNLSRELCRNRKEIVDSMCILSEDLEGGFEKNISNGSGADGKEVRTKP